MFLRIFTDYNSNTSNCLLDDLLTITTSVDMYDITVPISYVTLNRELFDMYVLEFLLSYLLCNTVKNIRKSKY